MGESITIETKFMSHEGGTKFYEVVQFIQADQGRYTLVKRWGGMESVFGGGQVKIEQFASARKLMLAAEKVTSDKSKRGYYVTDAMHGLFAVKSAKAEDLSGHILSHHYGVNAGSVAYQLGLSASAPATTDESDEIVSEEPPAEPERGAAWGSW